MSYHPKDTTSGLRWREDTGIEKRCAYCPRGLQWWPLTPEFWSFRQTFKRCKACLAKAKYAAARRRLATDPALREASLAYQRRYRAETGHARQIANQSYYWSDPERQRARARERYYRNRDRILERRRAAYQAERAA